MGFSPTAALAEVRTFKLARATETRNICPYCSVSCGVLIYTTGDKSKNAQARHHPHRGRSGQSGQSRHAVPEGCRPADMVKSANRLKWPEVREAGSNEWKRISWNDAIERIAKHMKADRDANFMAQNKDGVTVNRWTTTGFLASSAAPNEAGYLTVKTIRALGMTSHRYPGTYLTRPHGGQSGSEFWAWCDDQPLGGHQER
jgi:formate dehydrogenase major subunit